MAPSEAIYFVSVAVVGVAMVVVSVLVFVRAERYMSTYLSLVETTSANVSTPTSVDPDGFKGPALAVPSTAIKINERTNRRHL
uniref:WGS project CBMI000000000 data, contig CS3069_c001777 n=1 Tax=Fusarium clavum TaxID=2594811 RepID=A0A090MBZ5_9HYPO|nr:unnamed protein product [Fusarium clavum]